MYWRIVSTTEHLIEYINFEKSVFDKCDWSTQHEYEKWIYERGLKIFLLTNDRVVGKQRTPVILGSFNVFMEGNVAFMGGFSVVRKKRGYGLSKTLLDKLISEYGDYYIFCKTNPKDRIMKRVLLGGNFKNTLDKFEDGRVWCYWLRNPIIL